MNWLMLVVSFVGGISTAIQAGVNGALGKRVGTIEGSFLSFLIGTVALFLLTVFFGKGDLLQFLSAPKWQLVGGLLGAIYILCMVFAVPKIGIASAIVALITGQIITSAIIDHFGLVGGRSIPLDWHRILGIVLMAAALYLFYKR